MKFSKKLFLSTTLAALAVSNFASAEAPHSQTEPHSVVAVLAEDGHSEFRGRLGSDDKTALLSTPLPGGKQTVEDTAEQETTNQQRFTAPEIDGTSPRNFDPAYLAELKITGAVETIIAKSVNTGDTFQRKDRDAISDFYAAREYKPLWIEKGVLTDDAKALVAYLEHAEKDGLNASDYPVYDLGENADPESIAAAEIQLSETLLHYARDAQAGRVLPSKVSSTFKLKPVYPEPQSVITKLSISADRVAALASYHPPHQGYKDLRAELERLRSQSQEVVEQVHVPEGRTMAKGYRGERVAVLRQRLNIPAVADEDPLEFDETVRTAVRAFQSEHNLVADGAVGPRTLGVINRRPANRIHDVIANMERWRWMARDMGEFHVVANVPSYEVSINKNNESIHRTRVVVGKTKHKTPIFSDEMEYVVVNPYWNVPYSIASKELLPNIRSNPGYVSSRNYEVLRGGRVVSPYSVDWNESSFRRYRIRQRPGGRNALGDVKFLFPNDYAIYFHDTPSKSLFQRAARAFSHGCVRIHNPFEFGDVLMKHSKGWKNGRLQNMVGGTKERWIKLKGDERIPVHITYFTAVSDEAGTISYKSDVYGHNTRLKRVLGLI